MDMEAACGQTHFWIESREYSSNHERSGKTE
jgi:hypothetical protein